MSKQSSKPPLKADETLLNRYLYDTDFNAFNTERQVRTLDGPPSLPSDEPMEVCIVQMVFYSNDLTTAPFDFSYAYQYVGGR